MRLERTASTRQTASVKPPSTPPTRKVDADRRPQETWSGSPPQDHCQVEEREAQSRSRGPEELEVLFPGIKEGLSPSYLYLFRESQKRNPKTLFLSETPTLGITASSVSKTPTAEESHPCRAHRYAATLLNRTGDLLRCYCPEVFASLGIKLRVVAASTNNAGYEWVQGKARLTLQGPDLLNSTSSSLALLPSMGPFGGSHTFRRETVDLISFIHEYGHAIYDRLLGVPAKVSVNYANRALSEGFAVLLELIVLDHLTGINEGDADFEQRRRQRIDWLKGILDGDTCSSKWAYAEGTEIMVNLFRAGGLQRVRQFVTEIRPKKADALRRDHESYQEALCRPEAVLRLLR